ncbi:MAG: class I SAM-dependent methyltransferase [Bryobacteraceae bacterium]
MQRNAIRLEGLTPEKRKLFEQLLRSRSAGKPDEAAIPIPPAEPLPDEAPLDDPRSLDTTSPAEVKQMHRRFYNSVNRQLAASGLGDFSFFLNYGYVANGSAEHAAIPLPAHVLNRNSIKLVLETIGYCPITGCDVLDVGCGRGGTIYVMNRFFQPRTSTGIDLSPEGVIFCCRTHRYAGTAFAQGDAEQLPFRSGSFDVVSNVESSHSYPGIEVFYAEVHRVLRPGGTFLYTDSMPSALRESRIDLLRRIGFDVLRETDITANVLLSCDEIAGRRRDSFSGGGEVLNDFLAVPGSTMYEAFRSGVLTYGIWKLRK